jgi:hypothetical protein
MRKRTLEVVGRFSQGHNYRSFVLKPDGTIHSFAEVDMPVVPPIAHSYMEDVIGRGQHVFNNVLHQQTELSLGSTNTGLFGTSEERELPMMSWNTGPLDPIGWGFTHYVPTATLMAQALTLYPEFSSKVKTAEYAAYIDYPNWAKSNWRNVQVTLDQGFSAINFLLELKELRGLVKGHTKRGVKAKFHELVKQDANWRTRVNHLSSEWLQFQYGTASFVRDCVRIFQIISGWAARADKFLDEQGKIKLYRKTPLHRRLVTILPETRAFPVFTATGSVLTYSREVEIDANACVGYSYTTPESKGFISRFKQLLESFGIKWSANIVWNAIPFSFVVDWFINVDDWLERNVPTVSLIDMEVRALDFCHSIKVKETRTLTWTRDFHSIIGGVYPRSDLLMKSVTTYYRRRQDALPEFSVRPSGLNSWRLTRCLNATALFAQQVTKEPARDIPKKVITELAWLRGRALRAIQKVPKDAVAPTRERRGHRRPKR